MVTLFELQLNEIVSSTKENSQECISETHLDLLFYAKL
jgi:hypothetical protein